MKMQEEDTIKKEAESERFTDFARRIFAVPKDEYDKEAEAVKQGKPLRNPFDKKPAKVEKETTK